MSDQKQNLTQEEAETQLQNLLSQAKHIAADINVTQQESNENLDILDKKITEQSEMIEGNLADLQQAEKEADDELDKLLLEEAVELETILKSE